MKHLPRLVSLSALLLLIISCATLKPIEYRTFKNFDIQRMGFSSTLVKMDLVYFNPNSFGLQLKSTDIDIFINDVYLGHSLQLYQVTLPRKEEFSFPITIDVDMKNVLKNGLSTLFTSQVKVKIIGSVKVGKANTFIIFPIRYEEFHQFTIF